VIALAAGTAAERPGTSFDLIAALADDINHGRLFALGLAADLDSRHGLALSRDLGGVISSVYELERELAAARNLALGIHRGRAAAAALASARARARSLAQDLADARARDRAFRRTLSDALWYDGLLTNAEAYAAARDKACFRVRELAGSLAAVREMTVALASEVAAARDFAEAASEARAWDGASPARPAIRVAWTAAGLLARCDRLGYDLEFRSELTELAANGAGRWQQLRHSARLLVRAPLLRTELAAARRRQALP
jgi:hypothetical protein